MPLDPTANTDICTPARRRSGFSLIEVMIAMTVFSVVVAGTFSVALLTRYMADQQVYENTAFTVAQSIIEQIKSTEFQVVRNAARSGEAGALRTVRAAVEAVSDDNLRMDFLYLQSWNDRQVLVDLVRPTRRLLTQEDGSSAFEPIADWDDDSRRIPVFMRMRIRPVIGELADLGDFREAVTIVVEYEYEIPDRAAPGGRRWKSAAVRSVMSFIPTF